MNVQMYLTGFLSKPLSKPLWLSAHVTHQFKANLHDSFPFIVFIYLFQTFHALTALFLFFSRCPDAEVHFVNMTALTRGGLHSSFIIVDRKHIYIGSADMDWRSLSKVTANINNMSLQTNTRINERCPGLQFISCLQ